LGTTVFSKLTHTDISLNAKSHHHLVDEHSMLKHSYTELELSVARSVSPRIWNSSIICSDRVATMTDPLASLSTSVGEDLTSMTFLPFVEPTFIHISKVVT